jgi:hypothetical protein
MWMAVGEGFFATLFLVKVPEAMVHSPALTGGLALGAGLLVIAATLVTRVGAWRPWLFFALAFLATALPIGLSRIPLSGVTIGRDPVYQLRPAFLFLFAIVAACNGRRRFPAARAADAWRNAHPGVFVALACVAAVVVFGVYLRATSRVVHRGQWQAGATRQYFANLKGDVAALRARGIRPTVFSPDLPDAVVPAWVAPYNRLSINLMVPSIPASAADPHYRVAPDGHLQRVDFDEQYRGPISPATAAQWDWGPTDGTGCMAPRPGAGPLTVVLPKPLDGGGFLVRVQVRTRDPVAATVYADNDAFPTTLTNGSNDAFFDLPTVSQVGCIEQVAVGTLVPAGR